MSIEKTKKSLGALLSPDVRSFLTIQPLGQFIGGEFVQASSGETMETRNPSTDSIIATVAKGGWSDVHAAVASASLAFRVSGWSKLDPSIRATTLHRLADLVDQRIDVIAQIESLDVGKPLSQPTSFDVPHVAKTLRYYADLSVGLDYRKPLERLGVHGYTLRKPYGVCGFILPWNFPFLLLGWNVAPALAAGNTVVIKPSEETPLSTLYFAALAKEAGIPDGVVNVVTGTGEEAGRCLAQHSGLARIAFTGSPEVGRSVAEAAGKNLTPCKLELGGKGAAIVFGDVDPKAVAEELVRAITLNSGQVCCTATRWLIHESIYDRFVACALQGLNDLCIGDPLEFSTQMGPVVSARQRDRILGFLRQGIAEGAEVLLEGGEVAGRRGFFVKPCLLSGHPDNTCAQEEIFGPIAYLVKFKEEQEAVEIVNRSRYGLANSVWSSNFARATRVSEELSAGTSWINVHNLFVHGVPYGGVNLSGLGGGVLGPEALTDYLQSQSVVRAQ